MRAGARTGYVIPGRDGNGGWRFGEILPPSSSSPSSSPSTPQNRFWVKIYEICRKRHICTFKTFGVVFWAKKKPLREYRCEHPTFKNHKISLFYRICYHFIQYVIILYNMSLFYTIFHHFIQYFVSVYTILLFFIEKRQICTFKNYGVFF